ncbi:MAG: hypothetical protein KJO18_07150 [Acidimicrobiia bacterium]|nr:hypothetical protein [Acidimicrobiia bacterium]
MGSVVLMLTLIVAPTAAADELETLLETAHVAEYSGRQLVLTEWNDFAALETFNVQQSGGVALVTGAGGEVYVGRGRVLSRFEGTAVNKFSQPMIDDRYEAVDLVDATYLGRAAKQLDVYEGDVLRVSIIFDVETGAALTTEVFSDDGDRFRTAYMMSFSPRISLPLPLVGKLQGEFDVLLPEAPDRYFPATAGGYVRADSYVAEDETAHAFYSDGLFSFSVFRVDGNATTGELNDLQFERDGTQYRVLVSATDLTVVWNADGNTFVLIGDLPPDHLEAALDDLPRGSGFLTRFWRGLFG